MGNVREHIDKLKSGPTPPDKAPGSSSGKLSKRHEAGKDVACSYVDVERSSPPDSPDTPDTPDSGSSARSFE